jgi:hypothetical protein
MYKHTPYKTLQEPFLLFGGQLALLLLSAKTYKLTLVQRKIPTLSRVPPPFWYFLIRPLFSAEHCMRVFTAVFEFMDRIKNIE